MDSIFPQQNGLISEPRVFDRGLLSYGRSPVFDFQAGEFKTIDGKVYVGEGMEVLKNSIEKILRTERYRFPIYSFNYGITLEELVIKDIPYELLVSELKGQITQALLQDVRISGVDGFKFTREGSFLNIEFQVETFDKEVLAMEVNI